MKFKIVLLESDRIFIVGIRILKKRMKLSQRLIAGMLGRLFGNVGFEQQTGVKKIIDGDIAGGYQVAI